MPSNLLRAPSQSAADAPHNEAIGFPRLASERARRVKRSMDVVFAAFGIALVFPFACLIAVAILFESGGPALFSQDRIGRAGRRFRLWKFRTMVQDADEVLARHLTEHPAAAAEWNAHQKLRRDPRVTRMGRFLRRTSLDELPQLWNVLLGDMSLAGPRPIVESEIRHYGAAFPLYALAYPGLTGLWQVSGRNNVSYKRRVELDVEYVRNWTAGLDLKLFLQTFRVVLRGTGAY